MGGAGTLVTADAGSDSGAARKQLDADRPTEWEKPNGAECESTPLCFCLPRAESALSQRQREVLNLAALGLLDREIGAVLELAPQTIRHTLQAARKRLNARNTTHAVAIALNQHLIVLEDERCNRNR